ncbi:MAG: PAS domain-containing protein, partial [Chloroflexi bacterium]|nr:PAS domain-containing protein [Chloroflexota bacterium]
VVRASEERLRAFVNALPDIAFILDEQGRYVEIMAAEENLLYAGIAQLKGKLLHEVLPQEDADLFLGTVRQTIETGKPQILEYALGVQAGQTWFEGRTSPVRGLVGGQRAVVWVSRDITAYKLAEVALAKRAAELETVAQVSTAISTILDTTELLQTVSDLAKERFGLYHAHIYLLNEIGDTLVLAAGAGEAGRQMIAQGWSIPLEKERSLVVQAVRTRQGVIINDVRQEPKFMPNLLLPETQAEIAVPLLVGEQVLGVLDVQADTVDRFTQEDVRIQTIMAGQIVGALQNARLFVEQQQARLLLDERVKELNCLNEIGREIVETPPVSELLQWVTERIPSAMRYPEICATAIEYNGQIYGAPEAIDLTCQIVHALRIGGEIMGRIYISYAEKRDFLDEESALIGGIASRLSGYIESQRLLEQVQDALAVQEHLTVELDSQRRTLHAVLDNMPAGVFVAEAPAGKPVLANEQLKQLLGRGIALDVNNKETAEMYAIYRYGTDTLYPPDQTPLARGLLGEITTIDDMEVRQPDGSRILLQVVGAPIRDPQGSVSASVAIFQDITERKRAEMALWENQQLLRGFIDNSEAIIFVKDLQGRYLLVNNQFEILFNISKHEAVGKTDLDIFPKELARELRANDLKVLEARTSSQVEESVMFDDGPHTYLSLKFPFLDTAGVPYALGGISTNITETKRAEEVLRENQARLSEALNIARLAYWEFDLETQNLTFNDQFYAIFKTTAEQEGGHVMPAAKYAQKFVHPDDAGLIAREIQMLAESDDPNYTSQLEYRIIRADGEEGYLLVQFRRDQRGQSIGAVGIVQDITERKQSELEREKLLAEVEAAYRQYVRQEWQQFLGEQHQGNWHVEYQQVGSSSTEVEPSELDKTLAGAQNEVFSEGKTKIITGTNGNNQGNEAAIIAPIVLRGQVIGTFSLQDLAAERQWAAEEIALVEAVSEQLGVTIENLRLFDDTQKQATREQLTRQIADKMRAAPDVESIIQTGLTELGKALGVSRSYVKLTPKE